MNTRVMPENEPYHRDRTTSFQKYAVVPRWARIQGSQTFVSLNSRLESDEGEKAEGSDLCSGSEAGSIKGSQTFVLLDSRRKSNKGGKRWTSTPGSKYLPRTNSPGTKFPAETSFGCALMPMEDTRYTLKPCPPTNKTFVSAHEQDCSQ